MKSLPENNNEEWRAQNRKEWRGQKAGVNREMTNKRKIWIEMKKKS